MAIPTANEFTDLIHSGDFEIYFFDEIGSTNDFLMDLGKRNSVENIAAAASRQTAGKGSKGRSFYSPKEGLYLSALIKPALTETESMLITPAAACAVADALEKVSGKHLGIKWVNDIYLSWKKVCGILTESALDPSGERFYVVGIGINLSPPEGGFPAEFAEKTAVLFDEKTADGVKEEIVRLILKNLSERIFKIPERAFLDDYRNRSVLIGKNVTVTKISGGSFQAKVIGIDDSARLLISVDGIELSLDSGEVTLHEWN